MCSQVNQICIIPDQHNSELIYNVFCCIDFVFCYVSFFSVIFLQHLRVFLLSVTLDNVLVASITF
jgi:hypothetical protein